MAGNLLLTQRPGLDPKLRKDGEHVALFWQGSKLRCLRPALVGCMLGSWSDWALGQADDGWSVWKTQGSQPPKSPLAAVEVVC